MEKEAILNKLFGIRVDAPPLTPLDKSECLKAMDEYAASLLKENETFKDAMIERNDRCNELIKQLEYWKQRCAAAEAVILSFEPGITRLPTREAELIHEEIYNEWLQLKSQQK